MRDINTLAVDRIMILLRKGDIDPFRTEFVYSEEQSEDVDTNEIFNLANTKELPE